MMTYHLQNLPKTTFSIGNHLLMTYKPFSTYFSMIVHVIPAVV
jgi:hypothetical protein